MRKAWGIGFALVLAACASQSPEQRGGGATTAESQNQSTADPGAVDPERHDAIERTFARKTTELQDCWSREYEKTHDRKLEGDLTIQMTVAPDGTAHDVKIMKTSLNNAAVQDCVTQMVGTWAFPEGHASVPYLRTVHLGAQF